MQKPGPELTTVPRPAPPILCRSPGAGVKGNRVQGAAYTSGPAVLRAKEVSSRGPVSAVLWQDGGQSGGLGCLCRGQPGELTLGPLCVGPWAGPPGLLPLCTSLSLLPAPTPPSSASLCEGQTRWGPRPGPWTCGGESDLRGPGFSG